MIGKVLVISGPSGVGKTTLMNYLVSVDPNIFVPISYTTRAPRPGEVNGKDYFFISKTEFEKLIAANEFAEWAIVHDNYYGKLFKTINEAIINGKDVCIISDIQGLNRYKNLFPFAFFVSILPQSLAALQDNMERRGDNSEEINKRMRNAINEMLFEFPYNKIIVNRVGLQDYAKQEIFTYFFREINAPQYLFHQKCVSNLLNGKSI